LDYHIENTIESIERKKDDAMSIIKKITMLLAIMMATVSIFAQEQKVEMADKMRDNGRIYVVVAVVLTILIGLILYIVRLDKKMSRLEKENA
jgi:cytochrome bd-type quinol oxidase subunit 2